MPPERSRPDPGRPGAVGDDPDGRQVERSVMRRITWRLMPLLWLSFMAAFIDRVNVGFAKERMSAELGFSSAVYGFGAGIFFVGYFLFEVPSNLMLERLGARSWMARIMVTWGMLSSATMFVADRYTFYVLRFLLGAAEAGFFPGIILYLTYWFPAAHRSRAVAVFMTAAVAANVIGSPLSGALLELEGALGLSGWRWLFLIEGLPSIALGLVLLAALPNGPRDARWLPAAELTLLESRLAADRDTERSVTSLGQSLLDPRVLLLCGVYFCNVIGGYGLDFFMPTLVAEAFPAASPTVVGALNAAPSVAALLVMTAYGRSSDRRAERRWHFAGAVWWAATGLALASLPVPPVLGLCALALAVSGRWAAIAPFWGLSTSLLSSRAAAGAIALINSIGNLGGFVGPYLMGWLRDTTSDYRLGLRVLALGMLLGGVCALAIGRRARPLPSL